VGVDCDVDQDRRSDHPEPGQEHVIGDLVSDNVGFEIGGRDERQQGCPHQDPGAEGGHQDQ